MALRFRNDVRLETTMHILSVNFPLHLLNTGKPRRRSSRGGVLEKYHLVDALLGRLYERAISQEDPIYRLVVRPNRDDLLSIGRKQLFLQSQSI